MPSSVIKSLHYDSYSHTLRIAFVSGSTYDFENVPETTYQLLKNSGSMGTFFNQKIKQKYKYKKVN